MLDEFAKENSNERLPLNGEMLSNFNDHWARIDPHATQVKDRRAARGAI